MINRFSIEELVFEAENLKSMAHVLDIAVTEGRTTCECIAGASYLFTRMVSEHARKLDALWRAEV